MDIRLSKVEVLLPTGKSLFKIPELKIDSGTNLLIQGRSGSGKTTLLHLIAGLFLPHAGQVTLGKTDLNQLNDRERCRFRLKNVGVIFQKLNLLDHLTVAENVSLACTTEESSKLQAVERACQQVNLKGRQNERVQHMSLGEQQRVAVARVLAQGPSLILADEPTSSLDQLNADAVLKSLKNAAKGKTLVVVSHDHRLADQFERTLSFEELIR